MIKINKIMVSLFVASSIVYAGLIDAIAIKVNDGIITLADIDKKMQISHIDKQTAVNLMINDMIFEQDLNKKMITIDEDEIKAQLEKISSSNNMTLRQFKQAVKAQTNFDIYIDELKKNLLKAKLSNKILAGKLRYASKEDIKIYYDNNINLFSMPSKVDVIKYSSKNQNLLIKVLQNPMFFSKDIKRENKTINMASVNANTRYYLNGVEKGKFTKITQEKNKFIIYFVKEKKDINILSFEKVKDKIFQIIMKERENKFLKQHFNKLRLEANIEVLR
jgi:hypothetical protein